MTTLILFGIATAMTILSAGLAARCAELQRQLHRKRPRRAERSRW